MMSTMYFTFMYLVLSVSYKASLNEAGKLTKLLKRLPIDKLYEPPKEFALIKSWLRSCIDEHPHCAPGISESYAPMRLLDLHSDHEDGDLCLVGSSNIHLTAPEYSA